MLRVHYWGGARDVAGASEELVPPGSWVAVREELQRRHGDRMARVLDVSLLLVDGVRLDISAGAELADAAVLEVLPPFAGG